MREVVPVNHRKPAPPPLKGRGRGKPRERIVERSAGGVVVRVIEDLPHVLLIRDPYRKWGLPKGHIEEGERDEEAALREVQEETGLSDLLLGPDLGEIDWTFRKKERTIHKYCRFYLMASEGSESRPEVAEGITEVRWLPVGEALRAVGYENARAVLRRGSEQLRPPTGNGGAIWQEE